jgi:hypothetical protein
LREKRKTKFPKTYKKSVQITHGVNKTISKKAQTKSLANFWRKKKIKKKKEFKKKKKSPKTKRLAFGQ